MKRYVEIVMGLKYVYREFGAVELVMPMEIIKMDEWNNSRSTE